MEPSTLRDNPLLTRHLRSRLRPHELWPSVATVALVCAFLDYLMFGAADSKGTDAMGMYLVMAGLQGILVLVMGTAQVFASVFRAKESNVLDFHRISPLSALTLVVGFLFGAPIREYVLFLVTLPFSLAAIPLAGLNPLAWVVGTCCILVAGLLYHLGAIATGLVAEKGKAGYGVLAAGVLFLHTLGTVPPFCYFTVVPAFRVVAEWNTVVANAPLGKEFMGLILALLHQGLFIVFLLLGAIRKMRHEEMPLWSKLSALAFFFLSARLADLDIRQAEHAYDNGYLVMGTYGLWAVALWLTVMATPSMRDFGGGLRRAIRLGGTHTPAWMDTAPNHVALACLALLLGASVALLPGSSSDEVLRAHAAMVAVLSLLTFGFGLQAFTLQYRKKARAYFLFLLFVLWLVPLLGGAMVGLGSKEAGQSIYAMSPLAALGLSEASDTSMLTLLPGLLCNGVLLAWFALRSWRAQRAAVLEMAA